MIDSMCGTTSEGRRPDPWDQAYAELRVIAARLLRAERADHTLQPTALVHETFLRYRRDRRLHDLDRAEILSCAARTMRDVLVEHARRKKALKRGGTARRVGFEGALRAYEDRAVDLEALDVALTRLKSLDPQLVRIVELRFFGGLTEAQTADLLGLSSRTVRRAWSMSRRWLADEIGSNR